MADDEKASTKPVVYRLVDYVCHILLTSSLYSYPMVRYTDMDETMRKDVMEVSCI